MNDPPSDIPTTPMPVLGIVREAVSKVWASRLYYGTLILLPIIFTGAISFLEDISFTPNDEQPTTRILAEQALWITLYGIVSALLARAIHRSILLEERISPRLWFLRLSKREIVFLGWSFFIGGGMWLMFALGAALSAALAVSLVSWCSSLFGLMLTDDPRLDRLDWAVFLLFGGAATGFLVSYFAARTSLLLPAAALDHRQRLKWAWTTSKPHALRLTFLVGVIPLASLLLQAGGSFWIFDLLRGPLHHLLYAFVNCSLLVIEIAILSLAYRWITESASIAHSSATVDRIS